MVTSASRGLVCAAAAACEAAARGAWIASYPLAAEDPGGADEREVGERLREVADLPAADDIVLLGVQAEVIAQGEQPLNSARASASRPLTASAPTSQNEQARNWPSVPARPSSVTSVE
jgi:hypothetical protein